MTLMAKNERKMERAFLNEMKGISREIGKANPLFSSP